MMKLPTQLKRLATPLLAGSAALLLSGCLHTSEPMATGDLGVIIERATGSVQLINTTRGEVYDQVEGLGDLSHASIVFSRDQRYAYVFGRDGGLTKVDLLKSRIDNRIIQSGNSIGGAISQDGKLVAVSNYTPGGVRVFNAETLELVADLKATPSDRINRKTGKKQASKVVGLVDVPGQKFVFSLFDTDEIWVADFSSGKADVTKFKDIGRAPYDALVSPDGRYYIAGLFGEDGMAMLDLWNMDKGVKHILPDYGRGEEKLPVYKMPHLEGWAVAGNYAFVPAVGQHKVLVIDMNSWEQVGDIDVHGQPIFVMARPDGRQIWVNFAHPRNDRIQVIDTQSMEIQKTLSPGKAVLHMEFSPRGEELWLSARDDNKVKIYDTETLKEKGAFDSQSPSGIFFTNRAHQIGL